jgi:predicted lactoylglutathione lyase
MTYAVMIALPIADRRIAQDFYRSLLDVEPFGATVGDDGIPEPLQFALNDGVNLMLIPTGGFEWVIGDHEAARRGHSECLLSLSADSEAGVDAIVARAREAGARIVAEPAHQPWGYTGVFEDPDGHLWTATTPPTRG